MIYIRKIDRRLLFYKILFMETDIDRLREHVSIAVDRLKTWPKDEPVRLISNFDADGITSAAILIKALTREGYMYSISILKQITKEYIRSLKNTQFKRIIIADMGSMVISEMNENLQDREIIVLDHHQVEQNAVANENISWINPHRIGIDGSKVISAAGVSYFFAELLNEKNKDLAYLAIIGAIGDIQENNGFLGPNNYILETAVLQNKLKVTKGLKFYGRHTRPLIKLLEYSRDPVIPGVSGNQSEVIRFLNMIDISPKKTFGWRKIIDLDQDELMRLAAAIIIKRKNEKHPENVFGNIYELTEETSGTLFKDAKEFSTLLNACGRTGKASVGIGALLGEKKAKVDAENVSKEYKKQIVKAINWVKENDDEMKKGTGYCIINAGKEINASIIGTVASILSKSDYFPKNTYVLSIADALDGTAKVSMRIAGDTPGVNLKEIAEELAIRFQGDAGGHHHAAGVIFDINKTDEFLFEAEKVLRIKARELEVREEEKTGTVEPNTIQEFM